MELYQCIDHRSHCDEREQSSRDLAHTVAEVEQSDSEPAEDDREVQPTEERSLVREEDFRLHTRGQSNAFAWGRGEEGLRRHFADGVLR